MKRELFIIRHGKSSWDTVVDDIDRPLIERGVNNAYEMAGRLEQAGHVPELIYSSPANRALHTAVIMGRVWKLKDEQIRICRDLYLADEDDLFETVAGFPDAAGSLAIFGHNPGFTGFANHFLRSMVENIPTAGVVVLTFDMESWNEIGTKKPTATFFDFPKKHL